MTVEQLEKILSSKEGEHFEFKEARKSFHFETLAKYCAALWYPDSETDAITSRKNG